MVDFFLSPFLDYLFLKRALIACFSLSLSCAPLGVLILVRRMSLMGDALSHSIFPGVAVSYAFFGLSLPLMSLGGFLSAIFVSSFASYIARRTCIREDASLVAFYLISFAFGTIIVYLNGTKVDLMHILLGSILGINTSALLLIAGISTVSLLALGCVMRPLIVESFDPQFMRSLTHKSHYYYYLFMVVTVLNLVAAIQALGVLLALGVMMIPAITARFWSARLYTIIGLTFLISLSACYLGLLASYHFHWPSGPSIIMVMGLAYMISTFVAPFGILNTKYVQKTS